MKALDYALKRRGFATEIIEPSTRLKVHSRSGYNHFHEVLTLRQDGDEVLRWFWSWGEPIAPAVDLSDVVNAVNKVVL
ncbi:hypothetical protein [Actinomadura sp. DC4]|uniref:hypothetical protein n=1 Tax=Actinomadura sp. DC4 TaxID=3055069 RepID=UPI0025AF4B20|nr:hypothetical protein [Actinomadura sp. DC4]MDN3360181.1 hypothetical protein [Actinomadura sp. DC4]